MTVGIYCIINKVNGKRYIGQSINVEKRIKTHFNELKRNYHSNIFLQNAYNKYGENNFKFEILRECSENKLNYWYHYYIQEYNTQKFKKGYNTKRHFKQKRNKKHNIKYKTSTGGYRVTKIKNKQCKQGFYYKYQFYENNKRKSICSVSLIKLKQKVLDKGLEWSILDKEKAIQSLITSNEYNNNIEEYL